MSIDLHGLDAVRWKEVGILNGAGGVGGLLSWVYAKASGDAAVADMGWFTIPAYVVLGMGAAMLGIYLIAHSDTRAFARCMAFALACGFAWKPVFDGAELLVQENVGRGNTRAQMADLDEKRAVLEAKEGEITKAEIEEIGEVGAKLRESALRIRDQRLADAALEKIDTTLASLKSIDTHYTETVTLARSQLGEDVSPIQRFASGLDGDGFLWAMMPTISEDDHPNTVFLSQWPSHELVLDGAPAGSPVYFGGEDASSSEMDASGLPGVEFDLEAFLESTKAENEVGDSSPETTGNPETPQ